MQIQVYKNGAVIGPLQMEDVETGLENGSLLGHDLVWMDGMDDWEPISAVFNIRYQAAEAVAESVADHSLPDAQSLTLPENILRPRRLALARAFLGIKSHDGFRWVLAAIAIMVLVISWFVHPWIVGLRTEYIVERSLKSMTDDSTRLVRAATADYVRGLFSSTAVTKLCLGNDAATAEDGLILHHKLRHGRFARRSGDSRFVVSSATTTISRDEWPELWRQATKGMYGAREPVEIRSTVSLFGRARHEAVFSPADYVGPEGDIRFGGGTARFLSEKQGEFTGTADLAEADVEVVAAELAGRMKPVHLDLEYLAGSYVRLNLECGGLEIRYRDTVVKLGPLTSVSQWIRQDVAVPVWTGISQIKGNYSGGIWRISVSLTLFAHLTVFFII